jgi:hypothetical protein
MTGWDCHAHLFGPYATYPLADNRSYTPPEARLEAYLAVLARLGQRMVCWCRRRLMAQIILCCLMRWNKRQSYAA